MQSSYYNSSVVYPRGGVVSVENSLEYSAYGPDTKGVMNNTEELLTTLHDRFGSVSSFTGTFRADQWRFTINRQDPDSKYCNTCYRVMHKNSLSCRLEYGCCRTKYLHF